MYSLFEYNGEAVGALKYTKKCSSLEEALVWKFTKEKEDICHYELQILMPTAGIQKNNDPLHYQILALYKDGLKHVRTFKIHEGVKKEIQAWKKEMETCDNTKYALLMEGDGKFWDALGPIFIERPTRLVSKKK